MIVSCETCEFFDRDTSEKPCINCKLNAVDNYKPKEYSNSVLPVCAVRYALGRMTYMPSMVVEELIPMLPKLSDNNLNIMLKDVKEFLDQSDYFLKVNPVAIECDVRVWGNFYEELTKELNRRNNNE